MRMRAAVVGMVTLASCAAPTTPRTPDRTEAPAHVTSGLVARYAVKFEEPGSLEVEIVSEDGAFAEAKIERGAQSFVSGLVAGPVDGPLEPVDTTRWPITIPVCKDECKVAYRFDLDGVAKEFQSPRSAGRVGDALLGSPTTFLLRPTKPGDGTFEMKVETPPGTAFNCGLDRRDGVYRARLDDLPHVPYAVFGRYEQRTIELGTHMIEMVRVGDEPELGDGALEHWVRLGGESIANYFGTFPPERALVLVVVEEGRAVSEGTALGNGGAGVIVHVGRSIAGSTLVGDWILTHELVHLSMPGLASRHRWLEEGLATYLEPVARARIGYVHQEDVWAEWLQNMHKGQPVVGEGGLDGTERWGRIYWGGAGFWLQAEVTIAEETDGKKGLRDCLRAVVDAGGTIAARWNVRRFLQACDSAFGGPVVEELYDSVALEAVELDLEHLFERLGVKMSNVGVQLDDDAPNALVRRSLLAPDRSWRRTMSRF